ncbi:40S ribosomal protein S27 [Chelonia mydas]|uniref:40S ribosomal protein S27 n=1 Tax=Chelonia mydas TaxID=8469 RepID=M7BCQ2_CHEMY|nr:40S ribosomal protein S27 [Chelonia mydas]
MPLTKDLLHPFPEEEKRKHKKKRLVQSPTSYFMDVKCPACYKITTVFSHAQTVVPAGQPESSGCWPGTSSSAEVRTAIPYHATLTSALWPSELGGRTVAAADREPSSAAAVQK